MRPIQPSYVVVPRSPQLSLAKVEALSLSRSPSSTGSTFLPLIPLGSSVASTPSSLCHSSSARSLSAPEVPEQLHVGGVAHIDGRTFDLSRELGRGNFGVVFEAYARAVANPSSVAVKVSEIKGDEIMRSHLRTLLQTEIDILQRLTDELCERSPASAVRVPKYICHTVSPSKAVFAMTKVTGHPLDEWLYDVSTDDFKKTTPTVWVSGKLSCGLESHCNSVGLLSACDFACTLLTQLAPVLSVLEGIGVHRDISAHNLLIDDAAMAGGGCAEFSLIDFGMAVEAPTWAQRWGTSGISGDPRYWSPAHCLHMILGPQAFEHHHPVLARLYRERIDHYALGVVALEMLFGRWVGPYDEDKASGPMESMVAARRAWQRYWSLAWTLFHIMHSYDANAQAAQAVAHGLHVSFVEAHQKLCAALREAAAAVDSTFGYEDAFGHFRNEVSAVLVVAAELIDPASRLTWDGVPEVLRGEAAPLPTAADAVFDRCRRQKCRTTFSHVPGGL